MSEESQRPATFSVTIDLSRVSEEDRKAYIRGTSVVSTRIRFGTLTKSGALTAEQAGRILDIVHEMPPPSVGSLQWIPTDAAKRRLMPDAEREVTLMLTIDDDNRTSLARVIKEGPLDYQWFGLGMSLCKGEAETMEDAQRDAVRALRAEAINVAALLGVFER